MYSRMNTLHARSRLCVPPPKPASRLLLPTPPDLLRPSATSPRWPSLAQAHGGVPEDYPTRSRRRPEDDGTRGPDGDRSTGSWIWPARPPARSVGGSSARSRRPRSSAVSPRRAGRASPRAHHFGRQRRAGPAVRPVRERATSALRRRARTGGDLRTEERGQAFLRIASVGRQNASSVWVSRWRLFSVGKVTVRNAFWVCISSLETVLGYSRRVAL